MSHGFRPIVQCTPKLCGMSVRIYRQRLSTIVVLLSAERDLANARFAMIQSTADLLTASAAVSYAIGAVETPKRP